MILIFIWQFNLKKNEKKIDKVRKMIDNSIIESIMIQSYQRIIFDMNINLMGLYTLRSFKMAKYENVVKLYESGASKNEVLEALFKEGVPFSQLNKVTKELKFTWRGRSIGWREKSAEAFIENPNLTLEEYEALLTECGKKDAPVAAKYFYGMLSKIAQAK